MSKAPSVAPTGAACSPGWSRISRRLRDAARASASHASRRRRHQGLLEEGRGQRGLLTFEVLIPARILEIAHIHFRRRDFEQREGVIVKFLDVGAEGRLLELGHLIGVNDVAVIDLVWILLKRLLIGATPEQTSFLQSKLPALENYEIVLVSPEPWRDAIEVRLKCREQSLIEVGLRAVPADLRIGGEKLMVR